MAFSLVDVVRGLPWLRVAFVGGPGSGKSTLLGHLTAHLAEKGLARAVDLERLLRRHGSMWMTSWSLDYRPNLAGMSTGTRAVVVVDTPGGQLRNALTGAAGTDATVIVVDVERGFDPIAQRDVGALTLLAPRRPLIIALVGQADAAVVDAAEADARAWIGAVADEATVTRTLDELVSAFDAVPLKHRPSNADLRLDVLRRYHITGLGIVAVGFVETGVARCNDDVAVTGSPDRRPARIVNVHLFRESTKEIGAGAACSVLLPQLRGEEVPRGATIVPVRAPAPLATIIDVDIDGAAQRERPLPPGARLQLYARTLDVTVVLDTELPATGTGTRVSFTCHRPAALVAGDRVVLLEGRRAVAGGAVVRCG